MADQSIWTKALPYVQDGDPVRASVANAPVQVLADRTEALRALVDAIEAGQQLILRNAPLAASVPVGSVVYFEQTGLVHGLAQARWKSLQGVVEVLPAEEAVYTGVVITKAADRVGDILVNGYSVLSGPALVNLFGTAFPSSGVYYLSMTDPGTVDAAAPAMSVRVLQYLDGGLVRVFPPDHEPITHTHRSYRLSKEDWLLAAVFDPDVVPDDASYGYDMSCSEASEQGTAQALIPSVGDPCFLWLYRSEGSASETPYDEGGKHVDETLVALDENGIWWNGPAAPEADMEMVVTSADVKGFSVINAIRSLTPASVRITTSNGLVNVEFLGYTEDTDNSDTYVVKKLEGNKQLRGKMVRSVRAGRNVAVSPSDGQGDVTVELLFSNNELLSADVQNLNNAVTTVDEPHVITLFPDNREAAVTCRVILPNLGDLEYYMRVFAQFLSPAANQVLPAVELTLIPTPAAAGVTPVGPTALTLPNAPGTVAAGNVYYVESTAAVSLLGYSRGVAAFTLSIDSPVPALRLINTGIRLYLL